MPKRTKEEYQNDFDKKYGDYLIGKEGAYKCNKCKNEWDPTPDDVNRKACHCYYKLCGACRLYLYNREIARKQR
jgi:hypothetical protein